MALCGLAAVPLAWARSAMESLARAAAVAVAMLLRRSASTARLCLNPVDRCTSTGACRSDATTTRPAHRVACRVRRRSAPTPTKRWPAAGRRRRLSRSRKGCARHSRSGCQRVLGRARAVAGLRWVSHVVWRPRLVKEVRPAMLRWVASSSRPGARGRTASLGVTRNLATAIGERVRPASAQNGCQAAAGRARAVAPRSWVSRRKWRPRFDSCFRPSPLREPTRACALLPSAAGPAWPASAAGRRAALAVGRDSTRARGF